RVEVEEDPRRVGVAVDRQRPHVLFLRRFDHPVGDRFHLPVGLALADDEVVCDRRLLAHVEHDRLPGFLVNRRTTQQPCQLQWCRSRGLQQRNYPAYRPCAAMYCSTDGGTLPVTGSPAPTALRISL